MQLRPQMPIPPVLDEADQPVHAVFPRVNPYVLLPDQLGAVFGDAGFADPIVVCTKVACSKAASRAESAAG